MTVADMHTAIKLQVDKVDSLNFVNLSSTELDFFLNRDQDRFVKHRYREAEKTQKRMDDLREITTSIDITPTPTSTNNKSGGWFCTLPNTTSDTYWFALQEEVELRRKTCEGEVDSGKIEVGEQYIVLGSSSTDSITYNQITYTHGSIFTGVTTTVGSHLSPVTSYTVTSGNAKVYKGTTDTVEVKPAKHDNYNKNIKKDPFNKPVVGDDYSQLRRLQLDGKMEILAPTDVYLTKYILRYIRKPVRISLSSSIDCELSDHTHQEIVDMTVASILETLESERYKSNLNELGKLE
jgi:hypothetical protein